MSVLAISSEVLYIVMSPHASFGARLRLFGARSARFFITLIIFRIAKAVVHRVFLYDRVPVLCSVGLYTQIQNSDVFWLIFCLTCMVFCGQTIKFWICFPHKQWDILAKLKKLFSMPWPKGTNSKIHVLKCIIDQL